ncbi:MAG: hypothetical protein RI953_234 [Pseudomonadota bacterium]|jgi:protein-arginine deiminase
MLKPGLMIFVTVLLSTGGCTGQTANPIQSSPQRYGGGITRLTAPAGFRLDTDRNGILSDADDSDDDWSWQGKGAFVLPNLDDDDRDGKTDCSDDSINSTSDEEDLTLVAISWKALDTADLEGLTLQLFATADSAPVKWFLRTSSGWTPVENQISLAALQGGNSRKALLGLETCAFASKDWDGFMTIRLQNENDETIQTSRVRVSPFLMIPNTEKMETLFISRDSSGKYGNSRMLFELFLPSLLSSVAVKTYNTDAWQEMWMQDTMEIGYAESPTSRMHVVLNAPRGQDRFGRTLLAPDVGYIEVAQPRGQDNPGDGWLDWFGNLEVSPSTATYPHGRIYYGADPDTGNTLHPDVVSFLEAQVLQKPIALDTGWLFIKHVDEMLTFWSSPANSGFIAIMPSPALAAQSLGEELDDYNTEIQNRISNIVDGNAEQPPLAEVFGFGPDQLKMLPLLYDEGEHGATGRWSNPVNSVVVNKTLLYGRTGLPEAANALIKKTVRERFLLPLGVEDSAYQPRLGNVHCATNSLRRPPTRPFWQR